MTDTELENGLKLSLENAKQLTEEADGLMIFNRYPRAYSLYQLASEEIGKIIIIFHSILDFYNGTQIDEAYFEENQFKNHQQKTKKALMIELIVIEHFEKHINKDSGLKQKILEDFNNTNELNDQKNQSLYVSIKENTFVSPNSSITKKMAEDLAFSTKLRFAGIELFIQPLGVLKEVSTGLNELVSNEEKIKEIETKFALK
jgi:AbiV family abortive infection protein